MLGFKKISAKDKRIDAICCGAVAALAAIVFGGTLPDCAFPGESARLIVGTMGLDPSMADVPRHVLWNWAASLLGFATDSVFAFNMLSAVFGVASAWLLCGTLIFYVRECCDDDAAQPWAASTARLAGVAAGVAFVFSAPVWESATHAGFRMFDVMYMLLVFRLIVSLARHPGRQIPLSAAVGAATGLGMLESPSFVPLSLVYMLAVAATVHKADCVRGEDARPQILPALFAFLVALPAVFFSGLLLTAAAYAATPAAAERELAEISKAAIRMAGKMRAETRTWLPESNWVWMALFGFFPVAASVLSSIGAFGRDRHKPSQLLFHTVLTICLIVAVAPSDFPVRPIVILRPTGRAPAMLYTGLAAVAGYLLAYWRLLFSGPAKEKNESDEGLVKESSGAGPRVFAMVCGGALLLVLPVSAGIDSLSISSERGEFADKCANELLDAMGDKTWLVTRGGRLDDHLRLAAARRGRPLRLACLNRTNSKTYLKSLAEDAERDGLPKIVANAASVGVVNFFSVWLENDPAAPSKVAVFDIPDLWYQTDSSVMLRPVPDAMCFAGATDGDAADGEAAKNAAREAKRKFLAAWERLEPVLPKAEPDEAATFDGFFRYDMRRHMGFVGNNVAVCLQEAGLDREAFEIYTLVNGTIDDHNISSLFNLFEMSRPEYNYRSASANDMNPAVRRGPEYKRKLDEFVKRAEDDSRFRYGLWALSNTYGYIHSPQGALLLSYHWARSGMPRAAIAQLRKGLPMLPPAEQAELYNCIAMLYAGAGVELESEKQYRAALAKDPGNKNALRGLALLSLQSGDTEDAIKFFDRIKETEKESKSTLESGFACLARRDIDGAREQFQKLNDISPDDAGVLGLLCRVILQQSENAKNEAAALKEQAAKAKGVEKDELESKARAFDRQAAAYFREAEEVVLPKLRALSGKADVNARFSYHLSKAYVDSAKGAAFRKTARDEFYKAFLCRPHISGLADRVLRLDLELGDAKSARLHAKQVLSGNNHHVFANYTMGSLSLYEGDYAAAATFLEDAETYSDSAGKPRAHVKNDLAEVYRRTGRMEDAEKKAREAVAANDKFYVPFITLAAVLLDAGKDPQEARKVAEHAAELCKEQQRPQTGDGLDLRLRITLVRAQAECGDMTRARGGIREIKNSKLDMLSDYERSELVKLEETISRKTAAQKKK